MTTFDNILELACVYFRLGDIARQYELLKTNYLNKYTTKAEWYVHPPQHLVIQACLQRSRNVDRVNIISNPPTEPFLDVLMIVTTDRVMKRLNMDILGRRLKDTLAVFYGTYLLFMPCNFWLWLISTVPFHSVLTHRKFRSGGPSFQSGLWDLRAWAKTPGNFCVYPVHVNGENEATVRFELERLVDVLLAESIDAQKKFIMEVGQV